jgi:ElaB/YqjD/DUF883 family membrane-anchored ribosome-binding protein
MDSDEAKQAELEREIAVLDSEISTLYDTGNMVMGSDGINIDKKIEELKKKQQELKNIE